MWVGLVPAPTLVFAERARSENRAFFVGKSSESRIDTADADMGVPSFFSCGALGVLLT